jgi:hypothetical protein
LSDPSQPGGTPPPGPQQAPGWGQPSPWNQQPSPWNQQPSPWNQQPPQWQQPAQWQPGPQQPYGWQPPPRQGSKAPVVVAILVAVVLALLLIGGIAVLGSGLGTFMEGSSLDEVAVGQCFDGGRAAGIDSVTVIFNVETKDCAEPHESELIASFQYTGPQIDDYQEAALVSYSETECKVRFGQYVGLSFEASVYGMTYVYPLEGSWGLGDRSIECIGHPPDGQQTMVGSMRGVRR